MCVLIFVFLFGIRFPLKSFNRIQKHKILQKITQNYMWFFLVVMSSVYSVGFGQSVYYRWLYNMVVMVMDIKGILHVRFLTLQVLIFSQMTSTLDILNDYCYLRHWKFCRLDGSVQIEDRRIQVRQISVSLSRQGYIESIYKIT